jgi:hypothetical protein
MRRVSLNSAKPLPEAYNGPGKFDPQWVAYAQLAPYAIPHTNDVTWSVSAFCIAKIADFNKDKKAFFSTLMANKTGQNNSVGGIYNDFPLPFGYGMVNGVAQIYMPAQCHLVIHLVTTTFSKTLLGIQNCQDEGDANVRLRHIAKNGGGESATPTGSPMAYFGVARRGAYDMRGFYIYPDSGPRFVPPTIDPDGGNNGGTPYPPPPPPPPPGSIRRKPK